MQRLLLGFEPVEAGVEPRRKYERVQPLRKQGQIAAMAGDGTEKSVTLFYAIPQRFYRVRVELIYLEACRCSWLASTTVIFP
jgi:hypothetical protein